MEKEESEIPQIELLTSLRGAFFPDDPGYGYDDNLEDECGEPLDGFGLAEFEVAIVQVLLTEDDGRPCDFMQYFQGSEDIKEKVESAIVSVKNMDGVLYGCTTLHMKEFLETQELQEMMDYIIGQYSDGWGERFEQRDIAVEGGTLCVHFYQGRDFNIKENVLGTGTPVNDVSPVRPKLKLLGHDGNIFSILGDARHLLMKYGQGEAAREMTQRVENAGDYHQALEIISEYVETELSVPVHRKESQMRKPKERGESR